MTATASHSRLYAVGRLVLLVAAIALTVWGISLVAFSNSMRDTRVGIPIAFWGVLAGYAAIRMGNARTAGPAVAEEASDDATGEGAPASTELVRERDEAARREYEIRLELMLRRELEQGLREEMAALRRDVAELRGDVLDAVDGRLRMERVEITRIIGSNLAALHDDGRISLNPAAEVTVPAPGSADRPERGRGADADRDAPPSWTMPSTASAAEPAAPSWTMPSTASAAAEPAAPSWTMPSTASVAEPAAQRAARSVPDDAPGPGEWFDAIRDRPASPAATVSGSSGADQADETSGGDHADETNGADQHDRTAARSRSGVWSGEPFAGEPDAAGGPVAELASEPDPGAVTIESSVEPRPETVEPGRVEAGSEPVEAHRVKVDRVETGSETVEPDRVEAGSDTADPGEVEIRHVEAGAELPEAERSEPAAEPTSEAVASAEVGPEAATESSPRAVDIAPSPARQVREDPFADLPRLSSFRLPDLPEGVTVAPLPEPNDPEPARAEPSIPILEPARPGGGYVGRRRQGADEDAPTDETVSAGRHGARPERGARPTSGPGPGPGPGSGSGEIPASRHRG